MSKRAPIDAGATAQRERPAKMTVKAMEDVARKFSVSDASLKRITAVKDQESQTKAAWTKEEKLSALIRALMVLDALMVDGSLAGWLHRKNDAFDGSTPMEVIERGEISRIWQMICDLREGSFL